MMKIGKRYWFCIDDKIIQRVLRKICGFPCIIVGTKICYNYGVGYLTKSACYKARRKELISLIEQDLERIEIAQKYLNKHKKELRELK